MTLVEVSWALSGVSPRAITGRHSRRHLMVEDTERALCGVRIPWHRVHGSHEEDCKRCWMIMEQRGLGDG